MEAGAALHLVGSFEVGIGFVPVKAGEEAVIVRRAVVIRRVAVLEFGEDADHRYSEVAGQVPAYLAAAIGDSVDEEMTGCFDGAARQDQRLAFDLLDAAGSVGVLDTCHTVPG